MPCRQCTLIPNQSLIPVGSLTSLQPLKVSFLPTTATAASPSSNSSELLKARQGSSPSSGPALPWEDLHVTVWGRGQNSTETTGLRQVQQLPTDVCFSHGSLCSVSHHFDGCFGPFCSTLWSLLYFFCGQSVCQSPSFATAGVTGFCSALFSDLDTCHFGCCFFRVHMTFVIMLSKFV